MKYWKSISYVLIAFLLALFLFASTSCSSGTSYSTSNKVNYNRSSRVKAYKGNTNRNSYSHGTSVKKKYVIKK